MLVVKWILIGLVVLSLALLAAGQAGLLEGSAPGDLGVRDGRLKPPSATPNSASSQAALYPGHPMRGYAEVAPLPMRGDAAASLAAVRSVVEAMRGATVVKSEPGYLYVRFSTRWLGFIDDTEFWVDPAAGVIQVRSASRLGRKDFGVNRQRIEAIRVRLAQP